VNTEFTFFSSLTFCIRKKSLKVGFSVLSGRTILASADSGLKQTKSQASVPMPSSSLFLKNKNVNDNKINNNNNNNNNNNDNDNNNNNNNNNNILIIDKQADRQTGRPECHYFQYRCRRQYGRRHCLHHCSSKTKTSMITK
jgi:hypothetical protein